MTRDVYLPPADDPCPDCGSSDTYASDIDTGARWGPTPSGLPYVQGPRSYRLTCRDCPYSARRLGHPRMYRS